MAQPASDHEEDIQEHSEEEIQERDEDVEEPPPPPQRGQRQPQFLGSYDASSGSSSDGSDEERADGDGRPRRRGRRYSSIRLQRGQNQYREPSPEGNAM